MSHRKHFSTRLRTLRTSTGMSAYALAQRAGVTKQAVSKLEAGLSQPTWETVCRLADGLGVSVEAFRRGEKSGP